MNAAAEPLPKRSRLKKAVVVVALSVAAYAILGFLVVPIFAKKAIVDGARDRLGRAASVEDLSFNPFTLAVTARGFRLMEADGKTVFASFDRLDADGSIVSVYHLAPVVDRLTLAGLKVSLVRDTDTHYNVSDVIARIAARPSTERAHFSLSNIRLTGARVDFDDRPKGAKHEVSDIDLAIPFVSNLPTHLKEFVQPNFAARVNGTPIHITGETLPFENSLRTHVALDLDSFDIPHYVEYSPSPLPVKIDGGKLDAKISVRFTQAAGKNPTVDVAGTMALRDLAVSAPGDGGSAKVGRIDVEIASLDPFAGLVNIPLVKVTEATAARGPWHVASAEVKDIRVDAPRKRVDIASAATSGGSVEITRQRDGIEMPLSLAKEESAKPDEAGPWTVALAKATIDGYRVTLHDATVRPALTQRVNVTHAEAAGLSTEKSAKGTMAARLALDKAGTVGVEGTFALSPLDVSATVDARHIDIVPARRYVEQFKTVGLKSGFASAKGTLTLRGEGDAMRVGYRGTAAVSNLATIDTAINEDLLNWDAVRLTGIAFQYAQNDPLSLAIGDITVDKAYSRVVLEADGKLNLQSLKAATPAEPEAPAPADAKPRNVRIDRIVFNDSRLNFTDHFIRPNYTADVGGLSGTVTNLSSDPSARGVVDLKGSYDKTSPVVIAGTVNPLSGDLFLDIAAKGQDIELPKLSAYSLRYAGYGITKGRLTLDVKYHIENGKLEGRNKIFLDQLTFGEHVDNPEATKLPVLFAVNLLKDSKGAINLELPISGSLDDPQFGIGALVTQIFTSLLKKAVTSPFSLLTAAFGGPGGGSNGSSGAPGSDDLAYVDFDPGRDEIGDDGKKKLDAVAKALLDRPAIRIEMAPGWDAQKDGAALKKAALARRLKEAKRATLGKDAPPVDEITLGAEEYPRYLKIVYDQEAPPKPAAKDDGAKKDAKGAAPPPVPASEMESFLLERVTVSDEDFRALASRRGDRVKAYLVAEGRLPAERVLVAEAPDAQTADAKSSRVSFTLK
ncbi:MAG: DUF748 domain-containing protein [Usitatibacter sp.]